MTKKKGSLNREFEWVDFELDKLPPNEELKCPNPDALFIKSIIEQGMIQPIIATTYRNKIHIIEGRRRIKTFREIHKRYEEDPEFILEYKDSSGNHIENIDHLQTIETKLYKGISPHDRAIWGIVLNEQRSDNPLSFYFFIKELEKNHEWDEFTALLRTSKSTVERHLKLDKLIQQEKVFEAYQNKKIAAGPMFDMAVLHDQQQEFLLDILDKTGRIKQTDIKQAKSVRTKEALSTIPFDQLSTPLATPKDNILGYIVTGYKPLKVIECNSYGEASTEYFNIPEKERHGIFKRVK